MTQTYTIKPLEWREYAYQVKNPDDGSTELYTHYRADSIVNYHIVPWLDGTYHATANLNNEPDDSAWTESLEAAKEWCSKHLCGYLSDALEPVAVKGEGQ